MGREEDRKRFERSRMHQNIGRALDGTALAPMDRFGVRLKLGDLVLYTPTYPTLFQVSEVVPVLDPSAPAGTVQLVLSGVMPLVLNPNQPCISVVHIESPEGAEQAIKRHHAGRAVSESNGGGAETGGIEVVDAPPGHVKDVRVTRQAIDPEAGGGGDPSDGPTANAEGGGSIQSEGDSQGDGPGAGSVPGPVPGPQDPKTAGVGSAASGVGASEDQSHLEAADLARLDTDKG